MKDTPEINCDLMIIGTGIAGMAAAVFAADCGLNTVLAGTAGMLNYSSGLLDLLGVHPVEKGMIRDNPWEAIRELVRDEPKHPYALIDRNDMEKAFADFLLFLGKGGLEYHFEPERNVRVITPAGTVKPTYALPRSMMNGADAFDKKAECVIFDFRGLKGFSAIQIVETLKEEWPGLRPKRIVFPGSKGEWFAERMAASLESAEMREKLAEIIRPLIGNARYIGLPAILGIHKNGEVFSDMQERLNRPVFEIPIMPPSITGKRLRHIFERTLPKRGVQTFFQEKVDEVFSAGADGFLFNIGPNPSDFSVRAKGAILATGRFFGKGLHADRKRIIETVFGLPVWQPDSRIHWHRKALYDLRGHAINRAGIETDRHFRPLGKDGNAAFPNLFAAGSILAHQDWMRMKCGSGLGITTAFAAVKAFGELCM